MKNTQIRDVLFLCHVVLQNEHTQTGVYPEYGMAAAANRLVKKRLISEQPGFDGRKYIPTPHGIRVAKLCSALIKEYE